MKRTIMTLLLLGSTVAMAQKNQSPFTETDRKALDIPVALTGNTKDIAGYINANFTTQSDKVRAVFIWTASNIAYDIENMYAINFHEKQADKVDKALRTHKGICANYAAVFDDLCRKCSIRSFVITGYNKQNGAATYIPHAWCAAVIDNEWYLFDPTWGSGYEANNKFIKKINNDFFKVAPAKLIATHMPFDPMWELLFYPISNQEFYEGSIAENKTKPYFSYPDSIAAYEQMKEIDQWGAAARRTEQNGIKNGIIFNQLANLKQNIEIARQTEQVNTQNEKVNTYNDAVADYNNGINDLNDFIKYRNAQFTPKKTDAEIQGMVDTADHRIRRAESRLKGISEPGASIGSMIVSLRKSMTDALAVVDEQQDFLKRYFSKSKLMRKTMFSKYTWMGIPLN